jgi:hypothetical protein
LIAPTPLAKLPSPAVAANRKAAVEAVATPHQAAVLPVVVAAVVVVEVAAAVAVLRQLAAPPLLPNRHAVRTRRCPSACSL